MQEVEVEPSIRTDCPPAWPGLGSYLDGLHLSLTEVIFIWPGTLFRTFKSTFVHICPHAIEEKITHKSTITMHTRKTYIYIYTHQMLLIIMHDEYWWVLRILRILRSVLCSMTCRPCFSNSSSRPCAKAFTSQQQLLASLGLPHEGATACNSMQQQESIVPKVFFFRMFVACSLCTKEPSPSCCGVGIVLVTFEPQGLKRHLRWKMLKISKATRSQEISFRCILGAHLVPQTEWLSSTLGQRSACGNCQKGGNHDQKGDGIDVRIQWSVDQHWTLQILLPKNSASKPSASYGCI